MKKQVKALGYILLTSFIMGLGFGIATNFTAWVLWA
jgi:hypothetical protein